MSEDNTPRHGVELRTPFSQVTRRSVGVNANDVLLTGRWVQVENDIATIPGPADKVGLGLLLEGTHYHVGTREDFDGADSEAQTALPSTTASRQVTVAYGIFIYRVNSAGFDVDEAYAAGDLLEIDDDGRLIPQNGGVAAAKVERVMADANGPYELQVITLGS